MKFMMIVKANKDSEAGVMPTEEQLSEMGTYNERLMSAGALIEGQGLRASSDGGRVRFAGGKATVQLGPFEHPESLIAGYWIIRAKSKEEALNWAKQVPFKDGEVEVRQIFEMDDFVQGPAMDRERELARQLQEANAR